MKLLVCIAKTPDTTAKIAFKNNNTEFNSEGVVFVINPTDEWYALVRAIEIKEQLNATVTVITVGNAPDDDALLRRALAIGADDAVRIDTNPTDAYLVAAQIAQYAKSQNFDIILTGKETIDYNGLNIAGMLAELLDLPYIPLASKLDVQGNTATLESEIEGGVEILSVQTPFVVGAQKGMAEQRIPNMRGIMQAKTKPLQVLAPANIAPLTAIKNYDLPPARQSVKLIDPENVTELVRLLREEAKVL